jgi:hypothetical protein
LNRIAEASVSRKLSFVSAYGTKRTCRRTQLMSAFGGRGARG